ncbi:MAG: ribonuclease III [Clostridiales bacterium]|nr:ribonuclease III [Clostridiales bacterium]
MEESVTQPEQRTAECGSSLPGQIMTESGIGRSAYDTPERGTRPEDPAKDNKDRFAGSMELMFSLPSRDWKQYSALALAYIGDAVYELIIRTIFVKRADMQVEKLHRKVTRCVSAKAQAKMITALLPVFDEEEMAIYRRGRNAKPYTKAKNATMAEYLEATGFEAVMGYLYLEERFERMNELTAKGLEALGMGETRRV